MKNATKPATADWFMMKAGNIETYFWGFTCVLGLIILNAVQVVKRSQQFYCRVNNADNKGMRVWIVSKQGFPDLP